MADKDEQGYDPRESDQLRDLPTSKNPNFSTFQNCPTCPDLTKTVKSMRQALLGEDGTGLNKGVIHDILCKLNKLEENRKVTASWISLFKPIAISVIITAITTFLIIKFA
jgi:hypothetical protein